MQKFIRLFYREPDFIVRNGGLEYLRRWWVIPRNRVFNIYLHKFVKSDEDRALHDHPWPSLGMILWGKYKEIVPADRYLWTEKGDRITRTKVRYAFQPVFRDANWIHRIELFTDLCGQYCYDGVHKEKPVWTVFITGPWQRQWGFWCPFGFRHHKQFVAKTADGNDIGPGCE